MYRVEYLPIAVDDLLEIEDYLNDFSPSAADRFAEEVENRVTALAEYPLMCQAYEKDSFFRQMVIDDYLLFYSVDEKRHLVIIHRIFHHTRNISRRMLMR